MNEELMSLFESSPDILSELFKGTGHDSSNVDAMVEALKKKQALKEGGIKGLEYQTDDIIKARGEDVWKDYTSRTSLDTDNVTQLSDVRTTTIDPNKYQEYLGDSYAKVDETLQDQEYRVAEVQGNGERAMRALTNVGRTLTVGTALQIANMWDNIKSAFDMASATDRNALALALDEIDKESAEANKIYREKSSEGFSPMHFSWWMDNAASIASSATYIIPSGAIAKGSMALAKAFTGKKNAEHIGAIAGALYSNLAETMDNIRPTLMEAEKQAKKMGKSQAEIDEFVAAAGYQAYVENFVNVALEFGSMKRMLNMGKNTDNIISSPKADLLKEMGTEGAQELLNFNSDLGVQENVKSFLSNGSAPGSQYFDTGRLYDTFTDGDAWTAAFFGALGGPVNNTVTGGIKALGEQKGTYNKLDASKPLFDAAGNLQKGEEVQVKPSMLGIVSGKSAMEMAQYQQQQEILRVLNDKRAKIDKVKTLGDITGDQTLSDMADEAMVNTELVGHMQAGTAGRFIGNLTKLKTQLEQSEGDPAEKKRMIDNIDKVIKKSQAVEKEFNYGIDAVGMHQYDPFLPSFAIARARVKEIDEDIKQKRKKMNDLYMQDQSFIDAFVTEQSGKLMEDVSYGDTATSAKNQSSALKTLINTFNPKAFKSFLDGEEVAFGAMDPKGNSVIDRTAVELQTLLKEKETLNRRISELTSKKKRDQLIKDAKDEDKRWVKNFEQNIQDAMFDDLISEHESIASYAFVQDQLAAIEAAAAKPDNATLKKAADNAKATLFRHISQLDISEAQKTAIISMVESSDMTDDEVDADHSLLVQEYPELADLDSRHMSVVHMDNTYRRIANTLPENAPAKAKYNRLADLYDLRIAAMDKSTYKPNVDNIKARRDPKYAEVFKNKFLNKKKEAIEANLDTFEQTEAFTDISAVQSIIDELEKLVKYDSRFKSAMEKAKAVEKIVTTRLVANTAKHSIGVQALAESIKKLLTLTKVNITGVNQITVAGVPVDDPAQLIGLFLAADKNDVEAVTKTLEGTEADILAELEALTGLPMKHSSVDALTELILNHLHPIRTTTDDPFIGKYTLVSRQSDKTLLDPQILDRLNQLQELRTMLAITNGYGKVEWTKAITALRDVEKDNKGTYTFQGQQYVSIILGLYNVLAGENIFVQGVAGTGKSSQVIRNIYDTLVKMGEKNIAAVGHGVEPNKVIKEQLGITDNLTIDNISELSKKKIVIIDEAAKVNPGELFLIVQALQKAGVTIIFSGDVSQMIDTRSAKRLRAKTPVLSGMVITSTTPDIASTYNLTAPELSAIQSMGYIEYFDLPELTVQERAEDPDIIRAQNEFPALNNGEQGQLTVTHSSNLDRGVKISGPEEKQKALTTIIDLAKKNPNSKALIIDEHSSYSELNLPPNVLVMTAAKAQSLSVDYVCFITPPPPTNSKVIDYVAISRAKKFVYVITPKVPTGVVSKVSDSVQSRGDSALKIQIRTDNKTAMPNNLELAVKALSAMKQTVPVPVKEVVTDKEYNDFKAGKVPDAMLKGIAQAIISNKKLSPRQEEIYKANKAAVDNLNANRVPEPVLLTLQDIDAGADLVAELDKIKAFLLEPKNFAGMSPQEVKDLQDKLGNYTVWLDDVIAEQSMIYTKLGDIPVMTEAQLEVEPGLDGLLNTVNLAIEKLDNARPIFSAEKRELELYKQQIEQVQQRIANNLTVAQAERAQKMAELESRLKDAKLAQNEALIQAIEEQLALYKAAASSAHEAARKAKMKAKAQVRKAKKQTEQAKKEAKAAELQLKLATQIGELGDNTEYWYEEEMNEEPLEEDFKPRPRAFKKMKNALRSVWSSLNKAFTYVPFISDTGDTKFQRTPINTIEDINNIPDLGLREQLRAKALKGDKVKASKVTEANKSTKQMESYISYKLIDRETGEETIEVARQMLTSETEKAVGKTFVITDMDTTSVTYDGESTQFTTDKLEDLKIKLLKDFTANGTPITTENYELNVKHSIEILGKKHETELTKLGLSIPMGRIIVRLQVEKVHKNGTATPFGAPRIVVLNSSIASEMPALKQFMEKVKQLEDEFKIHATHPEHIKWGSSEKIHETLTKAEFFVMLMNGEDHPEVTKILSAMQNKDLIEDVANMIMLRSDNKANITVERTMIEDKTLIIPDSKTREIIVDTDSGLPITTYDPVLNITYTKIQTARMGKFDRHVFNLKANIDGEETTLHVMLNKNESKTTVKVFKIDGETTRVYHGDEANFLFAFDIKPRDMEHVLRNIESRVKYFNSKLTSETGVAQKEFNLLAQANKRLFVAGQRTEAHRVKMDEESRSFHRGVYLDERYDAESNPEFDIRQLVEALLGGKSGAYVNNYRKHEPTSEGVYNGLEINNVEFNPTYVQLKSEGKGTKTKVSTGGKRAARKEVETPVEVTSTSEETKPEVTLQFTADDFIDFADAADIAELVNSADNIEEALSGSGLSETEIEVILQIVNNKGRASANTPKALYVDSKRLLKVAKQFFPDITKEQIVLITDLEMIARFGTDSNGKPYEGYFKNGTVYLLSKDKLTANEYTLRHELFHKIWNQVMTEEERAKAKKMLRVAKPESALWNNLELEEFLADDWMYYNTNRPSILRYLWKKLQALIDLLFGRERKFNNYLEYVHSIAEQKRPTTDAIVSRSKANVFKGRGHGFKLTKDRTTGEVYSIAGATYRKVRKMIVSAMFPGKSLLAVKDANGNGIKDDQGNLIYESVGIPSSRQEILDIYNNPTLIEAMTKHVTLVFKVASLDNLTIEAINTKRKSLTQELTSLKKGLQDLVAETPMQNTSTVLDQITTAKSKVLAMKLTERTNAWKSEDPWTKIGWYAMQIDTKTKDEDDLESAEGMFSMLTQVTNTDGKKEYRLLENFLSSMYFGISYESDNDGEENINLKDEIVETKHVDIQAGQTAQVREFIFHLMDEYTKRTSYDEMYNNLVDVTSSFFRDPDSSNGMDESNPSPALMIATIDELSKKTFKNSEVAQFILSKLRYYISINRNTPWSYDGTLFYLNGVAQPRFSKESTPDYINRLKSQTDNRRLPLIEAYDIYNGNKLLAQLAHVTASQVYNNLQKVNIEKYIKKETTEDDPMAEQIAAMEAMVEAELEAQQPYDVYDDEGGYSEEGVRFEDKSPLEARQAEANPNDSSNAVRNKLRNWIKNNFRSQVAADTIDQLIKEAKNLTPSTAITWADRASELFPGIPIDWTKLGKANKAQALAWIKSMMDAAVRGDTYSGYMKSFIKNVSPAFEVTKVLSIRDKEGKNRFLWTIVNWGQEVLDKVFKTGFKSVHKIDEANYNPIFKNNIYKDDNILIGPVTHHAQGMTTVKDDSTEYDEENTDQWYIRSLVAGFINTMTRKTTNDELQYVQYTYTNSWRNLAWGAETKYLNKTQILDAIAKTQQQERDKLEFYAKTQKDNAYKVTENSFSAFDSSMTIKKFIEATPEDILTKILDDAKEAYKAIMGNNIIASTLDRYMQSTADAVNKAGNKKTAIINDPFYKTGQGFEAKAANKQFAGLFAMWFVNNAIQGHHLNQMTFGDHHYAKHDRVNNAYDIIKRMMGLSSPAKRLYSNPLDTVNGKRKVPLKIKAVVFDDRWESMTALQDPSGQYSKIYDSPVEVTNAGAFSTKAWFDALRAGTGDDTIQGVVKGVAFGQDANGETIFMKMAETELNDEYVAAFPEAKNIKDNMEAKEIHIMIPISGFKLGAPKTLANLHDPSTWDAATVEVPISDYGVQSNPGHEEGSVAEMSQLSYMLDTLGIATKETSEVYENKARIIKDSLETQRLLDLDLGLSMQLVDGQPKVVEVPLNKSSLLQRIGEKMVQSERTAAIGALIQNGASTDLPTVSRALTQEVSSYISKASVEFRKTGNKMVLQSPAFARVYEENGVVKTYDQLADTTKADKFNELPANVRYILTMHEFVNLYNKYKSGNPNKAYKTFDELLAGKEFGGAYKAMSAKEKGMMMEVLQNQSKYHIPRRLQMRNAAGETEVIMPQWWVDEHLSNVPEEARVGLAIRIPTTGNHSAIIYRIVGVYPGNRNIVIAPEELVAIHGSDFDVDSLFAVRYKYPQNAQGVEDLNKAPLGFEDGVISKESVDKLKTQFDRDIQLYVALQNEDADLLQNWYAKYDPTGTVTPLPVTAPADETPEQRQARQESNRTYSEAKKIARANAKMSRENYIEATKNLDTYLTIQVLKMDKMRQYMNTPISFSPFKTNFFNLKKLSEGQKQEAVDMKIAIKDTDGKVTLNPDLFVEATDVASGAKFELSTYGKTLLTKHAADGKLDVITVLAALKGSASVDDPRNLNNASHNAAMHGDNMKGKALVGIHASYLKWLAYLNFANKGELKTQAKVFGVQVAPKVTHMLDTYTTRTVDLITGKPTDINVWDITDTVLNGYIDNVKEQVTKLINATKDSGQMIATLLHLGVPLPMIALMSKNPQIEHLLLNSTSLKRDLRKLAKGAESKLTPPILKLWKNDEDKIVLKTIDEVADSNTKEIASIFLHAIYESDRIMKSMQRINNLKKLPFLAEDIRELTDPTERNEPGAEVWKHDVDLLTTNVPHIKAANDALNVLNNTIKGLCDSYSDAFVSKFNKALGFLGIMSTKALKVNKPVPAYRDSGRHEFYETLRKEYVKFLMSDIANSIPEDLKSEVSITATLEEKGKITEVTDVVSGVPAFMHRIGEQIKELQQNKVTKSPFLNLLTVSSEVKNGVARTSIKYEGLLGISPEQQADLTASFYALPLELQQNLIIVDVLNTGADFGTRSFTQIIQDAKLIKPVTDRLENLLQTVSKDPIIFNNVFEHFIAEFLKRQEYKINSTKQVTDRPEFSPELGTLILKSFNDKEMIVWKKGEDKYEELAIPLTKVDDAYAFDREMLTKGISSGAYRNDYSIREEAWQALQTSDSYTKTINLTKKGKLNTIKSYLEMVDKQLKMSDSSTKELTIVPTKRDAIMNTNALKVTMNTSVDQTGLKKYKERAEAYLKALAAHASDKPWEYTDEDGKVVTATGDPRTNGVFSDIVSKYGILSPVQYTMTVTYSKGKETSGTIRAQAMSSGAKAGVATVAKALSKRFNIPVRFVSNDSMPAGSFNGGWVVINLAKAGLDTPFHEFLHPFIDMIRKDHPLLYNNLMAELKKDTEFLSTQLLMMENNPFYKNLSMEEKMDEALVEYIGRRSAEGRAKSLIERFWNILEHLFMRLFGLEITLDQQTTMNDIVRIMNGSARFKLARPLIEEGRIEFGNCG